MKTLMAMGGALNSRNPQIMQEFVRRAGGNTARIVILPQASSLADTGKGYVSEFLTLGVHSAAVLEFRQRDQAGTNKQVNLLRNATGIFIAGGNQMRLSMLYGGTPLEDELHQAYQQGCLVGGTSAGAAILSKTMICNGKGGPTPREGIVQLSPGLGFTDRFAFDQHFRQRDRLGGLVYVVATHPGIAGVGIDEDTAAIVEADESITVCGSGAVTIVDGSQITGSDISEIEHKGPVAIANLTVHILTHGCVYDGKMRTAYIPQKTLPVK